MTLSRCSSVQLPPKWPKSSLGPIWKSRALADHTIVVQGERIVAVAPAAQVVVAAGARRVDGRGTWILPGLGVMTTIRSLR